jgi:hypothetical protein
MNIINGSNKRITPDIPDTNKKIKEKILNPHLISRCMNKSQNMVF